MTDPDCWIRWHGRERREKLSRVKIVTYGYHDRPWLLDQVAGVKQRREKLSRVKYYLWLPGDQALDCRSESWRTPGQGTPPPSSWLHTHRKFHPPPESLRSGYLPLGSPAARKCQLSALSFPLYVHCSLCTFFLSHLHVQIIDALSPRCLLTVLAY